MNDALVSFAIGVCFAASFIFEFMGDHTAAAELFGCAVISLAIIQEKIVLRSDK